MKPSFYQCILFVIANLVATFAFSISSTEHLSKNSSFVSIYGFKAQQSDNAVNVSWSSNNSSNKLVFTLQKSYDAVNFADIAMLDNGSDVTRIHYTFTDSETTDGIIYYRVKFAGPDKEKYSDIIAVDFKGEAAAPIVYPNPATKQGFDLKASACTSLSVRLSTFSGKCIYLNSFTDVLKDEFVHIELPEILPGIYILSIIRDGAERIIKIPIQ
jgi:hypothetical protein